MRYRWLGTWHAFRQRGRDTLSTIEPWIKVAMGGTFLSGYFGLSGLQSIGVGIAIVVAAEVAMLALGAFDFRNGVIQRQQQLSNEQDPWRMEMLALTRRYTNGYEARAHTEVP